MKFNRLASYYCSPVLIPYSTFVYRASRLKRARFERGSTIGEGGDITISSPGRSPKQPLPGIGLHDSLHGRQACPEFIASDQGVGQIYSR